MGTGSDRALLRIPLLVGQAPRVAGPSSAVTLRGRSGRDVRRTGITINATRSHKFASSYRKILAHGRRPGYGLPPDDKGASIAPIHEEGPDVLAEQRQNLILSMVN